MHSCYYERCIRCLVEFEVKSVTCPGVRLSSGHASDAHLCIYFFGQRVCTRPVPALFPFLFYETFQISKIYLRYHNLHDVFKALKDEYIKISLVQVSYSGLQKVLATYENNLQNFLCPLPNLVSSYSGAEREILLAPSTYFPGIIGPRLEFSTHTSICEDGECCPYLSGTHSRLSREQIKEPTSDYCMISEDKQVKPRDQEVAPMEDRPPFVVRKVDNTLFSRRPSLYKEYEGRRFYCCQSPHRYSKCAACRIASKSPSPTRIYTSNDSRKGRGLKQIHAYSPKKDHIQVIHQYHNGANTGHDDVSDVQGLNIPNPVVQQLPTPEILRQEQDQPSPSVSPSLLYYGEQRYISPPRQMLIKSPLFNKPTYHERFGNLPINVGEDLYNRVEDVKKVGFRPVMQHDHAQQTDYEICCYGTILVHTLSNCDVTLWNSLSFLYQLPFPDVEVVSWPYIGIFHFYVFNENYYDDDDDRPWRPPLSRLKDCCCCLYDQLPTYKCSCPYCPCYWRYRLVPPSGFHHWRTFHSDLANLYDCMYRRMPQL